VEVIFESFLILEKMGYFFIFGLVNSRNIKIRTMIRTNIPGAF